MADEIIVKYGADIAGLESKLNKIEKDLLDLQKASDKGMGGVEKSSKKAGKEVDKVDKEVKTLGGSLSKLAEKLPFAGAIQQMQEMGKSLGDVSSAAGGTTKTMQFLRLSMLAIPIFAIIAAFASLVAYFRASEEGGDKLAKIFNVIQVVGKKLLSLLIELGSKLVEFGEKAFGVFTQLYDVVANQVFGALKEVSQILEFLGFENAAKSVQKFNIQLQESKKNAEAATKAMIELGNKIADLEDKIGAETIDIALANSKLTTEIERQLKALRNKTNTYKESLGIIDSIGTLEQEKLTNSLKLINDNIALKKLEFIRDSKNQELGAAQFDAFINRKISAEKLLNQVTGSVTEDTLKGISEVLLAGDQAARESIILQERLNNFRDAAAQKEEARIAKEEQDLKDSNAKKLKIEQDNLEDLAKTFKEINDKRLKDEHDAELLQAKNLASIRQQEFDEKKKQIEEEKRLRQQAADEAIGIANNAITAVINAKLAQQTADIANEKAAFDASQQNLIKSLEARREAGLISQEQFDKEKARLELKAQQKERELKQKQFKAEQDANVSKVKLDTATAVVKTFAAYGFTPAAFIAVAALLANAGIQINAIRSEPVPKFKDGVIGLNGAGTGTSDSIHAMLSKGESVIKAKQSIKHTSALHAIQDDYFDKYVNENFVVPAMRNAETRRNELQNRQANTAENIMKAFELNGFGDTSHLERLTKANKKVIVQNMDSLPREIGKEINRAMTNNSYMR